MARNEEIAIKLTADDEASPAIAKLAKKIDGLESDEARIIVTADTKKLEAQLDRARLKLQMLDGDEATVQSRLVGTLEEDLEQAKKLLDQLEGQTATVKIDSQGARQGIDDLGKSADSSKSVMANMIGNTTQDLGALGGVAGSTGVAIGQMGEYMADAAGSGEKFGSILKSFAGVAAPILAIGAGLKEFAQHAANVAKIKAFRANEVEAYAEALKEADTTIGAIRQKLESGKGMVANFFGKDEDLTGAFTALGLSIDNTSTLIEGGVPKIDAWAASMAASGADADALAIITGVLKTNVEDLDKAQQNKQASDKFFADGIIGIDAAIKDLIPSTDELRDAQKNQADAAKNAADRAHDLSEEFRLAGLAADALKNSNQRLKDNLSDIDAYLTLKDTFREVQIAGDEAWQAAADGALDAGIKMDDYIQKQINATSEVLAFSEQIEGIPPAKLTDIQLLINGGSIDEAERRLGVLFQNRTMEVSIVTKGAIGFPENRLTGIR